MILLTKTVLFLFILSIFSFANENEYKKVGKFTIISEKHLINEIAYKKEIFYQAIVEIPTGTRQKWEVNHKSGNMDWTFHNGKPREVAFLGYPGNYGFIPQTLSGDGDALDILILSESVERGLLLKVKVLGMLKFLDDNEDDYKVIAVIENGVFENINSIEEMLMQKNNVIQIVQSWFEGYKGSGKMVFMGYASKAETVAYIEETHLTWAKRQ